MAWILGYGCTTAAGRSSADLWSALLAGRDPSSPPELCHWSGGWAVPSTGAYRICRWQSQKQPSARATLLRELLTAWGETKEAIPDTAQARLQDNARLGVVLATTKAHVDDFIWNDSRDHMQGDNLTPLLDDFLRTSKLNPTKKVVVSNACASSLSALYVARSWLESGEVDDVLVVAADLVGPFVYRGFECLRVLSPDGIRPFSADRSGFYLGEAAAALFMTRLGSEGLYLRGVGVDAEGFAITRPTVSGESLKRACLSIPGFQTPDLIVAHGTGTKVNDQTEARVYADLFPQADSPWITGTKWCVGHTLGPCGLLDVIAACQTLKTKSVFRLANTPIIDPALQGRYLHATCLEKPAALRRALVSSLGFGGIHAAALIEERGRQS